MPETKDVTNIIIFDMDKTLLTCDSMELWHRFLDMRGLVTQQDKQTRVRLHHEYVNGTLDVHENFRFEFSFLNKIPVDQREKIPNYFFENYLKAMVSKKALRLIAQYRKENAFIILSTSTMRFIAAPVAVYINADHLLATDGYIVDNKYTGQVYDPPNYQSGKKINFFNWLRNSNLTLGKITFYTDSINDIDLLEAVDIPIAVNPDEKLCAYAEAKNWKIVDFR